MPEAIRRQFFFMIMNKFNFIDEFKLIDEEIVLISGGKGGKASITQNLPCGLGCGLGCGQGCQGC